MEIRQATVHGDSTPHYLNRHRTELRGMKQHPNHRRYLEVLRRMSPEQRLRKAFELSDFSKALFAQGLRRRFSSLSEEEFRKLLNDRLAKCHNRIY